MAQAKRQATCTWICVPCECPRPGFPRFCRLKRRKIQRDVMKMLLYSQIILFHPRPALSPMSFCRVLLLHALTRFEPPRQNPLPAELLLVIILVRGSISSEEAEVNICYEGKSCN